MSKLLDRSALPGGGDVLGNKLLLFAIVLEVFAVLMNADSSGLGLLWVGCALTGLAVGGWGLFMKD